MKSRLPVRAAILKRETYEAPPEGRAGKIRLDFNENTAGCGPAVLRALAKITSQQFAMYPEYQKPTARIARYLGVHPEELVLTNGGDDALRVFFDTFEIWFWQDQTPVDPDPFGVWNDLTCGYGTNKGVHVDQHALTFVPGSSSILLAGNDGGVHGTTNADTADVATDPTWFNMDTGLNTIEFYAGDISGNFATSATPKAVGGAQDNGPSSVAFSGSPTGPAQWQMGLGGDGFSGVFCVSQPPCEGVTFW